MELTGKSRKELLELRSAIDSQLEVLQNEEFSSAVEEIKSISQRVGIPVQELVAAISAGQRKSAKPAVKNSVPPRYRDPANAEHLWTGRGRKPKWVEQWLKENKPLEDLLIKD